MSVPTRAAIEAELLEWMSEGPDARPDAERFERLALALFDWQYAHCEPYARLCRALGRTPASTSRIEHIPAVPTGAFKEFELRCFPAEKTIRTFRTSGTTELRRGALQLDTLALYEASLLASLRRCLLPGLVGRRPTMRFLAPDPDGSPDSSLGHMFECLRRAEGSEESGYDWVDGQLAIEPLAAAIERAREGVTPMLIAGTSFAFVHLLDAVGAGAPDASDWRLPPGSRVMETGGFKGRSREVPREALRSAIAGRFGIDERAVVNQYGMTELGSQFYDSTLVDPEGPRRKLAPPWSRVRIVDPETGEDLAPGGVGMIVVHDLANTGSVAAVQTADLGRLVLDDAGEPIGFDVLGRQSGAEARGCSIAADAMLEDARSGGPR